MTQVQLTSGAQGAFQEALIQELMFEHPEVLPLTEIEGAIEELISVCREMPTPHGPIDNLFITGDGHIVIAEAKLWKNPQARREVVAQALDYASCLFRMSYTEFESHALRGNFGKHKKPSHLWELVPEGTGLSEPQFVDAVSRNLKRGRIVILVVGDGIREGTEQLVEVLQSHAGFHFTFALVELSVFSLPGTADRLVLPRTLLRTQMVERGVVRIEDDRVSVAPARPVSTAPEVKRFSGSISAEEFFDVMRARAPALPGQLQNFLEQLSPLGVYGEFLSALNLKWDAPDGRTVNLGILQRNGQVWTSEAGMKSTEAFVRRYNEELAAAWGGTVDPMPWGTHTKWQVRLGGKTPLIEMIGSRLDAWVEVLRRLLPWLEEQLEHIDSGQESPPGPEGLKAGT
ncbi:hypothetical protein HPC49_03950 [Pyxidicoccus fallax]|uniref:Uncharacterized protein n=1 Tax=Pyxidicoccus fallax TaxID=394095 RepID=A0A848LAA5_9BACT|nr:hypothetical protein [Pyxidicoccus fallax]NMO15990.1 hypothetical protein [Pyxidicoccus fallax]NPC77404.1 hypothetical protein [Pyxidicoccus fallax]